jgi:phosphate transport system substrate-binding protein
VLVQGVESDDNALGFFGFAYYAENKDKLKIVPIDDGKPDNGDGGIVPSAETIAGGSYQPLSRPIFIYVSKGALAKAHVAKFVDFYLANATALSAKVGYVPLPAKVDALAKQRLADRKTGSVFAGGSKVGVTLEQLLASEGGS